MPFQTFCEDPAMLCKLGRTLWRGVTLQHWPPEGLFAFVFSCAWTLDGLQSEEFAFSLKEVQF